MSPEQMLRQFHAVADLHLKDRRSEEAMRRDLLDGEVQELKDALDANDLVEIADACADIVYVVVGTAIRRGIPFDAVLREVHNSNMTKLTGPGSPVVDDRGKILKGPNYVPPAIAPILSAHMGWPDDGESLAPGTVPNDFIG